ncbi:hypothetical protein QLL95_gp1201 [Cotonvirus japonicus]|uniref:TROVE domain-containing protein n=1 Tax=Cotonvirus japonicus TaxID=2811091 RepID=A0ABN6EBI9_9VIRU|nr:hypothetical protein QLL95_gp1201 [Cotonvirus japonicus]BCS82922.1 hypothetical protein [Cotonvirus japonicus]
MEFTNNSDFNLKLTENGDKAFNTSGNFCLDFFVRITRNSDLNDYISSFCKAWSENHEIAIKSLINMRDIRNGKGEKLIPIAILTFLKFNIEPEIYNIIIEKFIEYGCWKDLLKIIEIETHVRSTIPSLTSVFVNPIEIKLFSKQLQQDYDTLLLNNNPAKNLAISLCAKWAPSEKQHYNKLPLHVANDIMDDMRLTPKKYRQMITKLRKHLQVLELLMSTQQFDKIDFSRLPSVAIKKMKSAFSRDTNSNGIKSDARCNLNISYSKYLSDLTTGKTKVNVKGIQPHELVGEYLLSQSNVDTLVEAQWNAIKNDVLKSGAFRDVTAIVDVSGSMNGQPMQVAIALGILVAECTQGPFYGKVITFHEKPSWHHLIGDNLKEKTICMKNAPWGGSTNLRSVFDLILTNARDAKLTQDEMVKTLFIFTDMQFNACDYGNWNSTFEDAKNNFEKAGYKFPNIVCWNLRTSTSKTLPVSMNENGYVMLSGFSAELLKSVLNAEDFSPYKMLLKVLEPYDLPNDFNKCQTHTINFDVNLLSKYKECVSKSLFKKCYKKSNNSTNTVNKTTSINNTGSIYKSLSTNKIYNTIDPNWDI